ncbi:MAG: hypothetical protein OEZ34_13915, partial [Spirochaetia bacterium]|nr:hypothetical protein [Spirochaetia bacterium]
MKQENILHILYDLSITIASEDQHELLLKKVLMRMMQHTAFSTGMIFRYDPENSDETILMASIGDHRIKNYAGKYLDIPEKFKLSSSGLLHNSDLEGLPLRKSYYRSFLSFEIPDYGKILLLSQEEKKREIMFSEVFGPVLSNFSKTLKLCVENEAYQKSLIADRDDARIKALRFRKALD